MIEIGLNIAASVSVILKYYFDHFLEKARHKKLLGLIISLFTIISIWGGFYFQSSKNVNLKIEFNDIKQQYDSIKVFSKQVSDQLRSRDSTIRQKMLEIDSLRRKVSNLSSTSPKLDQTGRIELAPGFSVMSDFEQQIQIARSLVHLGKYDSAYKIAFELSSKNSEFALPYLIMGVVERARKKYSKAEYDLKIALKLGLTKEDSALDYAQLGGIKISLGDLVLSKKYLKKSIELDATSDERQLLLNRLEKDGNFKGIER